MISGMLHGTSHGSRLSDLGALVAKFVDDELLAAGDEFDARRVIVVLESVRPG
jgi:hypothetical protein